jgi:dTDP-4-dehydrorhamnose reductase
MAHRSTFEVYGTVRSEDGARYFSDRAAGQVISGVDVENQDSLLRAFSIGRPEVVVNCIGLVKQLADAKDPLLAVPINTLFPHRLARLCDVVGARLIHISTDCVFSGSKGLYLESDFPDADDLYGRTKLLGEVDYPNAITLRTSIIGHEVVGGRSLLGWFLAQHGSIKGFKKAVFSGLPTVELSRVVRDVVLPRPALRGVYHVAAQPIDKYALLRLVAKVYDKQIEIVPDVSLVIDRSLNAERFRLATGYVAPAWPELVTGMHEFHKLCEGEG